MSNQTKVVLGLGIAAIVMLGVYFFSQPKHSGFLGATQTYPLHFPNATAFDQVFTWGGLENAGVSWLTGAVHMSSTLEIAGATTFSGHIITSGTAPTVAVGGSGYTAGNVLAGSNDTKGTVTSTVATANGGVIVVSFATAFSSAPICLVSNANANAATSTFYVTSTVSSFGINTPAGLLAGSDQWNWHCIQ